jgi:hypothetical protein
MPPSSLEDRVRDLCAQVSAAKTETELRVILPQLQVRDFRAGGSAGEVEAIYGDQRKLRPRRQIHARRVRQTPSSKVRATALSRPRTLSDTLDRKLREGAHSH